MYAYMYVYIYIYIYIYICTAAGRRRLPAYFRADLRARLFVLNGGRRLQKLHVLQRFGFPVVWALPLVIRVMFSVCYAILFNYNR